MSLLPIVDEDFDSTVFVGGTMFHTLNSTSWGRAYWSLGMAAFYSRQTQEEWDYPSCPTQPCPEPILRETGLERRWKQFAVSLELPLAVQVGYNNHKLGFLGMHPIPNFSLMYFW